MGFCQGIGSDLNMGQDSLIFKLLACSVSLVVGIKHIQLVFIKDALQDFGSIVSWDFLLNRHLDESILGMLISIAITIEVDSRKAITACLGCLPVNWL